MSGRAVTDSLPERAAFKNEVWFSTPTTVCLCRRAQRAAATELTVSTMPE